MRNNRFEHKIVEVLTDRFSSWMEANIIDGPSVARKLVQKFSCPCFPDGYTLVSATSRNLLSCRIPARLQQVTLLTSGRSVVGLYAAVCRRERSDVPCSYGRVVCVG
jgi:hypothetical protein